LFLVSFLKASFQFFEDVTFLLTVQTVALEEEQSSSRAETPSTVTEVDMDLDSYQVALEEVLTWLLSAEDAFREQEEISGDVEEVKEQFATHEVSSKLFLSYFMVLGFFVCLFVFVFNLKILPLIRLSPRSRSRIVCVDVHRQE